MSSSSVSTLSSLPFAANGAQPPQGHHGSEFMLLFQSRTLAQPRCLPVRLRAARRSDTRALCKPNTFTSHSERYWCAFGLILTFVPFLLHQIVCIHFACVSLPHAAPSTSTVAPLRRLAQQSARFHTCTWVTRANFGRVSCHHSERPFFVCVHELALYFWLVLPSTARLDLPAHPVDDWLALPVNILAFGHPDHSAAEQTEHGTFAIRPHMCSSLTPRCVLSEHTRPQPGTFWWTAPF